jgi:hypothetical protein
MIPKPKPSEAPLVEVLNEIKTKAWNAAISPRLTALRAWYSGAEWKEGVSAYLNQQLLKRREHLEERGNDPRDDQYIKGQIAMLKEILAIPVFIEQQIEQAEKNKKAAPSGDAGY